MKPEIETALASLTPGQRAAMPADVKYGIKECGTVVVQVACHRCGGCGSYSYCSQYGTRCFECDVASGGKRIGWEWRDLVKAARMFQRNAGAEKRAIKRAAAVVAEAAALAGCFVSQDDLYRSGQVLAQRVKDKIVAGKVEQNGPVIAALKASGQDGGFVTSILASLEGGYPADQLSLRQKEVVASIIAKSVSGARVGSKRYEEELENAEQLLGCEFAV